MAWFKRTPQETQGNPKKVVIAEGLWIKCESCKEIMYRVEVEKAGRVCPKCHYPFRITARERIALLSDPGSFEEYQASLGSVDPLGFKDTKRYRDRLRSAKQKTALRFRSFFAPRTPLALKVRNVAVGALSIPLLANRLIRGSLQDDLVLPDYLAT